jgi:hypothetical protein
MPWKHDDLVVHSGLQLQVGKGRKAFVQLDPISAKILANALLEYAGHRALSGPRGPTTTIRCDVGFVTTEERIAEFERLNARRP